MKKPGRRRRPAGSRLYRLAVIAFAVYSGVTIIQLQNDVREKREQLAQLDAACAQQSKENADLEMLINDGSDRDYVERAARQRLDYAYPYEKVYINAAGS